MSIAKQILYEDNHIIVINKLPSQIVQGDKTGDKPLSEEVKDYVKKKYNKPGNVFVGVIHRLDRPASGIIIFAKTSKALSKINELVRNREIKKTYWAVVKNRPPEISDTLQNFLKKNEKQNKSYVVNKKTKAALEAKLNYKLILSSNIYHLIEIELITGRHHQIRCQLSKIGCPIKGDLKYGFPRSNKDNSIHLHARQIEFIHPIKKEKICIKANPHNEALWNYFTDMFK